MNDVHHRIIYCTHARLPRKNVAGELELDIWIEKVKSSGNRALVDQRWQQLSNRERVSLHLQLIIRRRIPHLIVNRRFKSDNVRYLLVGEIKRKLILNAIANGVSCFVWTGDQLRAAQTERQFARQFFPGPACWPVFDWF